MTIQVILASTRPNRVGKRVASWVMNAAEKRSDVTYELVDLADYKLEHLNVETAPRAMKDRHETGDLGKWLAKLAAADAYVIVTPEYNFSIPGVLKDALDYVDYQLVRKPVAIVSYGVHGGTRASEHLKLLINAIKGVAIPEAVALAMPTTVLDESGKLLPSVSQPFMQGQILDATLESIEWWAGALIAAGKETAQVK